MKRTYSLVWLLALMAVIAVSFASCGKTQTENLWEHATYTEDTAFGNGKTTVFAEVKVGEKSVTLTLHTDKATLGEAMMEYGLIDGEMGDYGLYVKVVNGITADYDVDQSYWGLYQDGAYLLTGADTTPVADGQHYEFVYSR